MLGTQRQGQPLGRRVGFSGKGEWLGRRRGREGRLLRGLAMALKAAGES